MMMMMMMPMFDITFDGPFGFCDLGAYLHSSYLSSFFKKIIHIFIKKNWGFTTPKAGNGAPSLTAKYIFLRILLTKNSISSKVI